MNPVKDKDMFFSTSDPDPRGLEHCLIFRHAADEPLGGALLRCTHDLWKLRALQLARRHPRRRILKPGTTTRIVAAVVHRVS